MTFDLIIENGRLVTATKPVASADLAIEDGKVAAWLPRGHNEEAARTIDAEGKFVMAGVVDPHVHIDLGPGEERYRESVSAAMGGVTTFLTYWMNGEPYENNFASEIEKGNAESVVDFGLHFGTMTEHQIQSIGRYVEEFGVCSYKHFMHFKGDEGAYMNVAGTDDGHFFEACEEISRHPDAVLAVHPENIEVVWKLAERLKATGRTDLAAYTESRPAFVETDNVYTAMLFGRVTGARMYIVHLSCREGLEEYKRQSPLYSGYHLETCPHYLTSTMYDDLGNLGKVNPPLREQSDVDALWEAVLDGTVDTIGSDHVPRKRENKQGTIWQASAGFPGMATTLPIMYTEGVKKRGLSLQRLAALLSENPARVFGLHPRKGTLAVGGDADVVIFDPEEERKVEAKDLGSFSDYSIYEGMELMGWPSHVLVRGETVMENGEIRAPEGHGQFIERGARGDCPSTKPIRETVSDRL